MFLLQRVGLIAACCLAVLLVFAPVTHAQDAPPAVQAALDTLNASLGTALTLDDLASWEWSQQTFPDRSLDCPREGFSYPEFATNGFVVEFAYDGAFYDYRVYSNSLDVFLCTPTGGAPGGTPLTGPEATEAAAQTPAPTGTATTPTPSPVPQATTVTTCGDSLLPRLTVGERAQSVASGSINIREPADLDDPDAVRGLLLPDGTFDVIDGPECVDGRIWWQIRTTSTADPLTGWVLEGDSTTYWLAPLGAAPTATPEPTIAVTNPPTASADQPITRDNASQLALLGRYPVPEDIMTAAFFPPPSADALLIDSNGQLHYYAGETVTRLALDLNHVDAQARHAATGPIADSTAVRIATLEAATDAGAVLYISTISGSPPTIAEQYGYQLPHMPNDLVFSPNGDYLAATSGTLDLADPGAADAADPLPNLVWLWDATNGQQLPTIQLDGPAADIAFSADGRYLAVTRPTSGVMIWSLETNSEVARLFNTSNWRGTPSLAFSPDGATLAVGTLDGEVLLYNLRDPDNIEPRGVLDAYLDADVRFLAFNRTGTLLATGGMPADADTITDANQNAGIAVWDTATGEQLATLDTDPPEPLTGLAFRGDDDTQVIATGSEHWWTWGIF